MQLLCKLVDSILIRDHASCFAETSPASADISPREEIKVSRAQFSAVALNQLCPKVRGPRKSFEVKQLGLWAKLFPGVSPFDRKTCISLHDDLTNDNGVTPAGSLFG